jgi:aquaporin Z
MFWLAPIAGAMLAGALARLIYEPADAVETVVSEERVA